MPEIDERVRELLHRKAGEVAPHGLVPRPLVRRARRRLAVNAVLTSVAVLAIAGGALAGVRAVQRSSAFGPAGDGSHGGGIASPTGPVACAGSDLRAVASLDGAAGSREGAISLTNGSGAACTLEGTPGVALLDASGDPIAGVQVQGSPAGWQAEAASPPPGWPVVTLDPGASASVRIRWSNWCPNGAPSPSWRLELPGGGTLPVQGTDELSPPPCNGEAFPSTVEVGPFEPAVAGSGATG